MKKVIALDIGGTNTRCALINEKYEIEKIQINPTKTGDLDVFLESVAEVINETVDDFKDVVAISGGVPGRVRYDGFIQALPNVGLGSVPLAEFLSKRFNLPCYIRNDAEVAALAEANVGPYKNEKSLFFVTISTGVGGAMAINGKLRNSLNESGHTMTEYKGEYYQFEHLASGTGIKKLCSLNKVEVENAREFFEKLSKGDKTIEPIYRDWISLVAGYLNMINDVLSPSIFTLTGGVMKSADLFLDDLRKACPACHIEKCGCDQMAGLLGAAVFGFQSAK